MIPPISAASSLKTKPTSSCSKASAVLQDLQEKLYAQDQWAVLLIFQAMDAAGKDSLVKHVMSGVNPQACEVSSFKQPSTEELNHDFLWRATRRFRSAEKSASSTAPTMKKF